MVIMNEVIIGKFYMIEMGKKNGEWGILRGGASNGFDAG